MKIILHLRVGNDGNQIGIFFIRARMFIWGRLTQIQDFEGALPARC
jgi:hypothetical protein